MISVIMYIGMTFKKFIPYLKKKLNTLINSVIMYIGMTLKKFIPKLKKFLF